MNLRQRRIIADTRRQVNRLTRELTQLRQQSASVASTASSASAGPPEAIVDPSGIHSAAPLPHSTTLPIRHRRSSSSTSGHGRILPGATGTGTNVVPGIHATTTPSQASIERARGVSRQNSITSRRSRASSPAQPTLTNLESLPPHYQHRQSLSSHHQHPYQHHHHPAPLAHLPSPPLMFNLLL